MVNIKFQEHHTGYSHGQHDYVMHMLINNKIVAYASYSEFDKEININYVESIVKNKGYGQQVLEAVIKKYGYDNINFGYTSDDGTKLMKKITEKYGEQQKKDKHLPFTVIEQISVKHPKAAFVIANFYANGARAWNDYTSKNIFEVDGYDINDLADISEWISGSATNDYPPTHEVPYPITELVKKLTDE